MLQEFERAYAAVVRGLAFPLQETLKGHDTMAILRQMQSEQRLAPAQLAERQQQRLQAFLTHLVSTVDFYQALFRDLNLLPGDIRTVEDLQRLPLLDKATMRRNLDRMLSSRAQRVTKSATGGSSGEPLIFYLGPTRIASDVAARCRAESWFGVGVGDPEIVVWGSPLEISKQDRARLFRDWIMRTRLLSAFEMSPATMDRYLDEIAHSRCRRIFGYPSSIALLCERARKTGRDFTRLGVRAVFVTAEYLWDHWRQIIAETFACPVANGYGGRESGFIAHECPAGSLHVTADRMVVEIVDAAGKALPPGQSGEIVVTHLDTWEMPLLRYRTGDIAAWAGRTCPCGSALPILDRLEGRKTDFIVAPDGRIMHGLSLIYVLRETPGLAQFRIVQNSLTDFDVELVRVEGYDSGSEAQIRSGFGRRLRAPVTVRIHYREAIPPLASGKFQFVVSHVAAEIGQGPALAVGRAE